MPELKTLFHKTDPETSREAAEKMVKSGALNRQEQEVYNLIRTIPGSAMLSFNFTAKELAVWGSEAYYTIQRRLSGLRGKGKIIRTGEKRDGCCVWRLKGE